MKVPPPLSFGGDGLNVQPAAPAVVVPLTETLLIVKFATPLGLPPVSINTLQALLVVAELVLLWLFPNVTLRMTIDPVGGFEIGGPDSGVASDAVTSAVIAVGVCR